MALLRVWELITKVVISWRMLIIMVLTSSWLLIIKVVMMISGYSGKNYCTWNSTVSAYSRYSLPTNRGLNNHLLAGDQI